MATEEWLLKAIQTGKNYEELPSRVRSILPVSEWKHRVKEYCVARGLGWGESPASQVSAEMEYYEELLRFSKHHYRLFPYHLSDYVSRVLRITPFRYYCDVLYNALKEEKQYDQIPNFTAADVKRLCGIGRNEYIEILNQCKAKKLLWRVNKGIAREFLPTEPAEIQLEPWWHIAVVNIGETEYRALTAEELKTLQDACHPGGSQVSGLPQDVVLGLYARGLVYVEVPIAPDDVISIPHLDGFVSNKDSAVTGADPLEQLLYQVFVAASETTTVAELADMLSVSLPSVRNAVAVACRLGFALRAPRPGGEVHMQAQQTELHSGAEGLAQLGGAEPATAGLGIMGDLLGSGAPRVPSTRGEAASLAGPSGNGQPNGKAVALVVDATVTSYLMMGSLPGLKRHAVTLFEGGRVSGAEPMGSLIEELQGVDEKAMDVFEGEMQELMSHTAALAHALAFVRAAAPGGNVELLRRESLAGLSPTAASRMLARAYSALLPVTPMPGAPLPLVGANLVNFGHSVESASPWMQLAMHKLTGCGLPGVVFVAGQRVVRLPSQLQGATHVLIWPWDAAVAGKVACDTPIVVSSDFLLMSLNDHLTRTAVLLQPLRSSAPEGAELGGLHGWRLDVVHIPLPLNQSQVEADEEGGDLLGVRASDGRELVVVSGAGRMLCSLVTDLGLSHALGYVRLLRTADDSGWIPMDIHLGLPLFSVELCRQVCSNASKQGFLTPESLQQQAEGQVALHAVLQALLEEHSHASPWGVGAAGGVGDTAEQAAPLPPVMPALPHHNLLLGKEGQLQVLDTSAYVQCMGIMPGAA